MSQELTTRKNQQGDEELGYWEERDVTDNEGQPTGEKIRRWVPQSFISSDLKTLGNDYETNGPTGAPKILALLHIVDKDSKIVQAESAVPDSLVLSFYRLTKSSDNVDKLKQREYQDPSEPVSTVVRTVTRWKYIQLFNRMYEDEITGQTVNNESGRNVLEFGPEQTVFNPEYIFSMNWNVFCIGITPIVGPAVALFSFDEDESVRQHVTDVEVLNSQFPNNRDGNSWIVPAKLSNPECIYVGTKYRGNCSLFDGFDEEKIKATMNDIVRQYTETTQKVKEKNDTVTRQLEGEIKEIESKHAAEIQKINDQNLNYLSKIRKERQVKGYTKKREYLNDLQHIINKKAEIQKQIDINNKEVIKLVNLYNQEKAKLAEIERKKPIVYYGLLFGIKRNIRFFIEPDFSEGSLVNLVYKKCINSRSSGGKRRNNNCYLKFRKTKRKNAKPLRKNTKKYYRRSNRK